MTCIVSAYYKIPSKRPHEKYVPDLIRWFRSVGTSSNVHFFTTEDVRDELKSIVNTGSVVFHILPFEQLTAITQWGREFWERQYDRDPERYHSPELGMIWYEKRHFVRRVMEIDPSTTFIWCDAGCVRDDLSEKKAMMFGQRTNVADGLIHLQVINTLVSKEFYTFPDSSIAGAIIAGTKTAWQRYTDVYDKSLVDYDHRGISGMSDQYVTMRCIIKSPDIFAPHTGFTSVDGWFKFLELL